MGAKKKELGALAVSQITRRGINFVGGVAGLGINVTQSGSRSWILRYQVGGKRKDMGLGGYPDVTLAQAKESARYARAQIAQGIDPINATRAAKRKMIEEQLSTITFRQAATQYIDTHEASWRNDKHVQQWRNTIETYANPKIGSIQVRDINLHLVMSILEPIWIDKTETAIGLTRTLLAFNASALLIPMLIGGIILAVALLIDEFLNFKEGNDSFLGDLVKDYPQLLTVINAISDGVAGVINWMQGLFGELMPAFSGLGAALGNLFTALWPAIQFGFSVITTMFEGVLQVVMWVAKGIVGIIAAEIGLAVKIVTGLVDALAGTFNWLSDKITSVVGAIKTAVKWVGKVVGLDSVKVAATAAQSSGANAGGTGGAGMGANTLAASGPLGYAAAGPATGGSTVSNSNNTNVTVPNINITSPDPAKAGQSVREELNKANRSAVRNGQSAVLL